MKNLKKVLALVLALASVMGLGITASAKEYTDSNSIEYTEAVDVMSAIGILDGNPDGSFNPQGSLTRAQAAKMVSYLLNGGKDVNDLYSGSCQFTDCYSNWARGYIAYVNQMGIVSGVGNGKFNPNGTLTGVQLAKMMLTSLGYDAKVEGYQGNDSWMVNIINDAQNAGLLKGMDTVNLYSAITREQASQMMFNALKADVVNYESKGTEIELPGIGTIITGASDPKTAEQGSYADNLEKDGLQLSEKYFGGTKGLKQTKKGEDDFGRPAHEWMYDAKTIATYVDEADLTYTAKVELGDIYKDLGKIEDKNAEYYIDGMGNKQADVSVSSGNDKEVGGQGVLTQVYVIEEKNSKGETVDGVKIVEVNTYTTTISKYNKATDDKEASISLTGETSKFETDAFTKDDEDSRVIYTKAKAEGASTYEIKSVELAESVDGVMTKYSDSAITVDGTSYKLAAKADKSSINATDFESTYTYYMDSYGNIIFVELKEAGASKDYAYVEKVDESDSLFGGSGVKAQIILSDGTKTIVDVATNSKDEYNAPQADGSIKTGTANGKIEGVETSAPGTWFSYTVNSNKEYTFRAVNSNYASIIDMTGTGDGKELVKDKATTFTITGGKAYTNADTIVTSVDEDYNVSTATGLIGADLEGKVLVTYNKGSKTINAIYAVNQTITLSNADVTYAYALKQDGSTKDGDVWKFAIDGKTETYVVDTGALTDSNKGQIFNLQLNGDKVVGGLKEVSNTAIGEVDFADANTVVVEGKTYTTGDKFAIYNVDEDLASSEVGTTDTLDEGDTIKFVTDGKDTILVAFITSEAE